MFRQPASCTALLATADVQKALIEAALGKFRRRKLRSFYFQKPTWILDSNHMSGLQPKGRGGYIVRTRTSLVLLCISTFRRFCDSGGSKATFSHGIQGSSCKDSTSSTPGDRRSHSRFEIDSSIFHLQYILRRRSSRSERLCLGIVSVGWC